MDKTPNNRWIKLILVAVCIISLVSCYRKNNTSIDNAKLYSTDQVEIHEALLSIETRYSYYDIKIPYRLSALCKSLDDEIAIKSLYLLSKMYKEFPFTLDAAISAFNSEYWEIECAGYDALLELGMYVIPRIRELSRILMESKHEYKIKNVSDIIGKLGPCAHYAVNDLKHSFQENEERYFCIKAIGKIGSTDDVDYLYSILESKNPEIRESAIRAIGEICESGNHNTDILRKYLEDEDYNVRIAAAESIWRVSGYSEDYVYIVIKEMPSEKNDKYWAVRNALMTMHMTAMPSLVSSYANMDIDKKDSVLFIIFDIARYIPRDIHRHLDYAIKHLEAIEKENKELGKEHSNVLETLKRYKKQCEIDGMWLR